MITIEEILDLLTEHIEYHQQIIKDSWLPWDMEWAEKNVISELKSVRRKIERKNKSRRKE